MKIFRVLRKLNRVATKQINTFYALRVLAFVSTLIIVIGFAVYYNTNLVENESQSDMTSTDPFNFEVVVPMYTTKDLCMTVEPFNNSQVIEVVYANTVLDVNICNNYHGLWYEIFYNGNHGYINSSGLRKFDENIHLPNLGVDYIYQDWVREMIDLFELDIDEFIIYGMMYAENRFQSEPESPSGAQGILQIMPATWNSLYKEFCCDYPEYSCKIKDDPLDIKSNITLGVYYLKVTNDGLDGELSQNLHHVLTYYNRGPSKTNNYYKNYGTYETEYSRQVVRASEYIRENHTWKEGI